MVAVLVSIVIVVAISVASGRERHATQHFAIPGRSKRFECGSAGRRRGEPIADHHQSIRIGTLVAIAAHGRGNGPNRYRSVPVDASGDIAQAVRGWRPGQAGSWIIARGIAGNSVRSAEIGHTLRLGGLSVLAEPSERLIAHAVLCQSGLLSLRTPKFDPPTTSR